MFIIFWWVNKLRTKLSFVLFLSRLIGFFSSLTCILITLLPPHCRLVSPPPVATSSHLPQPYSPLPPRPPSLALTPWFLPTLATPSLPSRPPYFSSCRCHHPSANLTLFSDHLPDPSPSSATRTAPHSHRPVLPQVRQYNFFPLSVIYCGLPPPLWSHRRPLA